MNIESLDWQKMQDLVPVIVQDSQTANVLMLGYMNQQALQQTLETGWVTFYSRSRKSLWTKGETSGNRLKLTNIAPDCDNDALLIQAEPTGPTCHRGTTSCFAETPTTDWSFIQELTQLIEQRQRERPEQSYTTELFASGIKRIAQKVGEEGVEVSLAACAGTTEELTNEAADLLFHLLVLLRAKGLTLKDIIQVLRQR